MLPTGTGPHTTLQRGFPSNGHPCVTSTALTFPNPQGDGTEGFPGSPGRPGDPGDRVSVLREGKAGRSWPCQEPGPKGTLSPPALGSLGVCLVTPKVTTSPSSSAGPSGTAGGAGQEGEQCRDPGDSPAMPWHREGGSGSVPGPRMSPELLLPLTLCSSYTRGTVGRRASWERRARR